MSSKKDSLLNQIDNLRNTIYEVIDENDNDLTNSKVLSISQQLDRIINEYNNLTY